MKLLKNIRSLFILSILTFSISTINGQDLDKATVKNLVDSKSFIFKAQTVLPMGGASRQLTPDYDLKLFGDSMVAYLPYFGRAYGPINPNEGGIKFTSTDFEYNAKPKKKGGWEVSINPKDAKDVRQLFLSISSNGYASLQITSNNRQTISYHGYITSAK